jgi:hypothetical protein
MAAAAEVRAATAMRLRCNRQRETDSDQNRAKHRASFQRVDVHDVYMDASRLPRNFCVLLDRQAAVLYPALWQV